jgi:hypothetical protein
MLMAILERTGDIAPYRMEIHVLKPGQIFEGFGGSRHGIMIRGSPSLILREHLQGQVLDYEFDVDDLSAWRHIVTTLAGSTVMLPTEENQ